MDTWHVTEHGSDTEQEFTLILRDVPWWALGTSFVADRVCTATGHRLCGNQFLHGPMGNLIFLAHSAGRTLHEVPVSPATAALLGSNVDED